MTLRVQVLESFDLEPWVPQLRELERSITYPLADGEEQFYIDHGPRYHPFFSTMGERAGFICAFDGERLVGTFAGVLKRARLGGATIPSMYLADYKIRAEYRGGAIGRRILWGCVGLLRYPELRTPRIFYGAAMRGARGDLMRSARGSKSVMKLTRPIASLDVYFADPDKLARLDLSNAPGPPAGPGLDLSPDVASLSRGAGIVSTAGRKDLRIVSTNAPFPLEHLPFGPELQQKGFGADLKACGEQITSEGAQACFAIDERLTERTRWLQGQGIVPGARATVYALRLARAPFEWVHLATSEI